MEDQVVAILHLCEEQAMLAAGMPAFLVADKRRKYGKPLLAALEQIARGQRIGQFLQSRRFAAPQKGVASALVKSDPFLRG